MIDFAPKILPQLIERVRGYKLVANDPFDSPSSMTFHFENIQYEADSKKIHHHDELDCVVVPQALTDEEMNQPCHMFNLMGQAMTEQLVIPVNPTREELEQFSKLLTNSILLNYLIREDAESEEESYEAE